MARPLIIAHRGLTPTTTENAISSLASLAAAGADLVEFDIRLSLDRRPIVIHDAFISRTTRARGWVGMWPSPLLRRVPLRGGEPGECVPLLQDVLQAWPPELMPALHLKDRGALRQVLRVIEREGDPSRTWLWLERAEDVRQARHRLPDLRCTLLRPDAWQPGQLEHYLVDARACGAHAVSLPWGLLTQDMIKQVHQHEILAFSRLQIDLRVPAMIQRGLDGIITDDPEQIIIRLKQHTATS